MVADGFDLGAYCARIGYDGPRTPTLDVLRAVHRLHAQAIAFENLDPFLGRPVGLEPASVFAKLVGEGGRGGYCFEQNRLMWDALAALGFRVSGLAARVLWNRPEDAVTPRSHMALRVALDGDDGPEDWLADVGFGGLTLTAPLRLVAEAEQETPHEPFRLRNDGDSWRLQAKPGADWTTLYRFDLAPAYPVDYEVSSHYLCTHPQSHFINGLIAARPFDGGRHALMNNRLTTHRLGAESERRTLNAAAELREALADLFDIVVPDPARFDALVAERGVLEGA